MSCESLPTYLFASPSTLCMYAHPPPQGLSAFEAECVNRTRLANHEGSERPLLQQGDLRNQNTPIEPYPQPLSLQLSSYYPPGTEQLLQQQYQQPQYQQPSTNNNINNLLQKRYEQALQARQSLRIQAWQISRPQAWHPFRMQTCSTPTHIHHR